MRCHDNNHGSSWFRIKASQCYNGPWSSWVQILRHGVSCVLWTLSPSLLRRRVIRLLPNCVQFKPLSKSGMASFSGAEAVERLLHMVMTILETDFCFEFLSQSVILLVPSLTVSEALSCVRSLSIFFELRLAMSSKVSREKSRILSTNAGNSVSNLARSKRL